LQVKLISLAFLTEGVSAPMFYLVYLEMAAMLDGLLRISLSIMNSRICHFFYIKFLTSSWFFDCTVSYRLSLNFIGKLCKITQITLYCVRLMGYLPRWNLFMKKKVYLYKKSGICGCSWYSMKFVINHPAWLPFLNKLNRT
jgi:hypothetical protein